MTDIAYQFTNNTIVIVLKKQIFNITKGSEKFERVLELIKSNQLDLIEDVLAPVVRVKKVLKGSGTTLEIDKDGNLFDTSGAKFPAFLGKKILELNEEGFPVEIFLNFWANLKENPSVDSREDLFSFLESNHHPLTPDGCFLAYKKVRKNGNDLFDSQTGKIRNNPGDSPKMNRKDVNPNRNKTCSTGLHVASWDYAQGFSGNTLICVKVNPKNVVTVPTDYNRQKMRTCEYTVEFIYEETKPITSVAVKPENYKVEKDTAPVVKVKEDLTKSSNVKTKEDLAAMTAKQIVAYILETYGVAIADVSNATKMKNKEGIINKAWKIITGTNV